MSGTLALSIGCARLVSHVDATIFTFLAFCDNDPPFSDVQLLDVLLLDGSVLGVDVAEDEVELRVGAALVRPEHDRVRSLVRELPQVKVLVVAQQLDVAATAVLSKENCTG